MEIKIGNSEFGKVIILDEKEINVNIFCQRFFCLQYILVSLYILIDKGFKNML